MDPHPPNPLESERLTEALAALDSLGAAPPAKRQAAPNRATKRKPRPRRPNSGRRSSSIRAPRGANRAAVLGVLAEHAGVSVTELSTAADVARPVLYALLKTLEERGEVVKEELPAGVTGFRLGLRRIASVSDPGLKRRRPLTRVAGLARHGHGSPWLLVSTATDGCGYSVRVIERRPLCRLRAVHIGAHVPDNADRKHVLVEKPRGWIFMRDDPSVSSRCSVADLAGPVDAAMGRLARRRPLFHSEADFQLALAWELQHADSAAQLRLEQRVMANPPIALDILMRVNGRRYAFELKYLKRALEIVIDDEPFKLATGAPDVEHYDILNDVTRLERLTDSGVCDAGCALVLTNVDDFWKPRATGARVTGFDEFRLFDGRELQGELTWGASAGPGTRRGREAAIVLRGTYTTHWRPYSHLGDGRAHELRYLAVLID
jgi:hypothetical protein